MKTKILTGITTQLDKSTRSAINKQVITENVYCTSMGIISDEQQDKRFHGGSERALHYYPAQHYQYWKDYWLAMNLPTSPTPFKAGAFGENISGIEYDECNTHIGDIFSLGETILQISQPRSPCYKINIRFAYPMMSIVMQTSGKTGWLMRVLREGMIHVGDELELIHKSDSKMSVRRCCDILYNQSFNEADLNLLSNHLELSHNWRRHARDWVDKGRPDDWSKRLFQG